MKKRLFSMMFLLLLLISVILPAGAAEIPAERQKPRLVDDADFLTDQEEARFCRQLDEISEAYELDIAIVLVPDLGGQEIMDFADDYYDYNGYGMGENDDGVLLVISENPRKYWVTSHGSGDHLTTPWAQNFLETFMVKKLRENDYAQACHWFIRDAGLLAEGVYQGRPYHEGYEPRTGSAWGFIIGFRVVLALAIAAFIALYRSGKSLADKGKQDAASYVVPGSLQITREKDDFLITTYETKDYGSHYDVRDGSSTRSRTNAGSHESDSGRSHGGFGGDY